MDNSLVKRLGGHLKVVPVIMGAMDEIELKKPLAEGKWSKKEILGHLVDSGVYNLTRFTQVRFSEAPFKIIPYPQAPLVKANGYQDRPLGEILDLWKSLNQQIVSIWESYTEEELSIPLEDTVSGNRGNLAWWMLDYTEHLEHHLSQILGSDYKKSKGWFATRSEALAALPKNEKPFVKLLEHGSMYVEYYTPKEKDLQTPHEQDELYVIDKGEGVFYNNGVRHTFEAGDVLFVPAGIEHRFEKFSEGFATWVIFYGPKGGE